MRSIIAGTSSNSDTAGRSTAVSASETMARNTSSAKNEARKLGNPICARRSASGERMMVRTIAVTSGRNTTDPIDKTKGSARNRPTAMRITRAEIRRNSCAAKASVRRRGEAPSAAAELRSAGASLPGSELIAPPRAPLLGRNREAPTGGDVVQFLQDSPVRRRVPDRPFGYLAVLDHRSERGASPADAALDRTDRAAANLRCLFVREAAGAHQQQRFAPLRRQREQGAVHVRQVNRLFLSSRSRQNALSGGLVIFAAESIAAHVGEIGVAQDHERPRAHAGAGFEPVLRRPRLEQRFLDELEIGRAHVL